MTDAAEQDLRGELMDALADAEFPVTDRMDLVPVLPDGPTTTFEAGDRTFTAMELAANLGGHQSFPYETAEALVDDVIEAMRAEGLL
jgi:hypothetical protein